MGGVSPGRLAKKETWELSDLAQFREGQQSALISERFTSGGGAGAGGQGRVAGRDLNSEAALASRALPSSPCPPDTLCTSGFLERLAGKKEGLGDTGVGGDTLAPEYREGAQAPGHGP